MTENAANVTSSWMSTAYGDYFGGQSSKEFRLSPLDQRTYSVLMTRYKLAQNIAERAQQGSLNCGLDDGRLHCEVRIAAATKMIVRCVLPKVKVVFWRFGM